MAQSDVPDEVKRLLREHISSIEQLEILLLLRARADSELSPQVVSLEMRTSETSVAARLADMEERGFVASRRDGNKCFYKYAPSDAGIARAVDLLERAYAERRYRVMELIFSKPIDNLRVFAGAFRFRKDDSDG